MKQIAAALLFLHGLCLADGPTTLQAAEPETAGSNYLTLTTQERRFVGQQFANGGALAVDGESLLLGTAANTFVRIDPRTWAITPNALPALLTGEADLPSSKRYKHKEPGRPIVGLLAHGGGYFVSFTRYDKADDFARFVVAQWTPQSKKWAPIFESRGLDAPYLTRVSGGRMAVRGDSLIVTIGDYSLDRKNGRPSDISAQNPSVPWGKIHAIDLRTKRVTVLTMGHRNPHGLAVLRDGSIISTEHGPRGGDEINVIEQGKNYGWPYISDGEQYDNHDDTAKVLGPPPAGVTFTPPAFSFVPSSAITQVLQIEGFHPKWAGNLLIASLRAQTLYHVKWRDGRAQFVEPVHVGHRMRDLVQIGASFYALTDAGSILQISAKR